MVGVGGSSPLGRTISQRRDLVPYFSPALNYPKMTFSIGKTLFSDFSRLCP